MTSLKSTHLEPNRLKLALFNKRQQLGLGARVTGVTEQDPWEEKYSPSGNLSSTSAPSGGAAFVMKLSGLLLGGLGWADVLVMNHVQHEVLFHSWMKDGEKKDKKEERIEEGEVVQ